MPATIKKQLIQEIEEMPDELQEKMLKIDNYEIRGNGMELKTSLIFYKGGFCGY